MGRVVQTVASLVLLVFVLGCKLEIREGRYQGVLLRSTEFGEQKEPVSIDVSVNNKKSAYFEVKDIHDQVVERAELSWTFKKAKIRIPRISPKPFILFKARIKKSEDHWSCYTGNEAHFITACFSDQTLLIDVTDLNTHNSLFKLIGDSFPKAPPFTMEAPSEISLPHAIEEALKRNFDSRMEFERLTQSKHAVAAARLNMLPHANLRQLAASTTLNPFIIASFTASFAPFLIPTRWFQLKEAKNKFKEEKVTVALMKADLAIQVQNLAYIWERDRQIHALYQELLNDVISLKTSAEKFINSSELKSQFDELINGVQLNLIKSEAIIAQDRRTFAEVMGYHNPYAISSIDLAEETTSLESIKEISSPDEIAKATLARALEVKQINYLIETARLQKEEFYWNWADSDIDPKVAISLGVGESVIIAQSRIHELLIKQEKIQANIHQRAIDAVANHNLIIQSYPFVKNDYYYQEAKKKNLLESLPLAQETSFNFAAFRKTYYSLLSSKITMETLLADYRISRAKIDRMLLEGYYSSLASEEAPRIRSNPRP